MLLACVAANLASLAVFGFVGSYTRWYADDYYLNAHLRGPIVQVMRAMYAHDNSRYSASLAWYLLIPRGIYTARLLPAAAIAAWLCALWWLALEMLPKHHDRAFDALLCASTLLFAVLASTPSLGQAVYWEMQLLTYTAPLILATAAVALLVRLARTRSGTWLYLAGFLGFVIAGFSEIGAAVFFVAAAAAALFAGRGAGGSQPQAARRFGVTIAVAMLLGLIVMGMAPATAVRAKQLDQPPSVFFGLTRSVVFTVLFLARSFLFCPLASVAPLAVGMLLAGKYRPTFRGASRQRVLAAGATCSLVLLLVAFLPTAYVLSGPPPSRALIIPQYILVLAMFGAGWVLADKVAPIRVWRALAIVLLVLAPLVSLAETLARVPGASTYAAVWDRRDAQLRDAAARAETHVRVQALPERLSLVRGVELPTADPNFWVNQSMAAYYGIRSITVSGNPEAMAPEEWQEGWKGRVYQRLKSVLHR
ncbi:MAG: DUF6056 family protein [Terriglobales bacterium]